MNPLRREPGERDTQTSLDRILFGHGVRMTSALPLTQEGLEGLPGGEAVARGLADLAAGIESEAALLVSIGAPRLKQAGLTLSPALDNAEEKLWSLLGTDDPDAAHSRYNALIRLLISFERALECAGR